METTQSEGNESSSGNIAKNLKEIILSKNSPKNTRVKSELLESRPIERKLLSEEITRFLKPNSPFKLKSTQHQSNLAQKTRSASIYQSPVAEMSTRYMQNPRFKRFQELKNSPEPKVSNSFTPSPGLKIETIKAYRKFENLDYLQKYFRIHKEIPTQVSPKKLFLNTPKVSRFNQKRNSVQPKTKNSVLDFPKIQSNNLFGQSRGKKYRRASVATTAKKHQVSSSLDMEVRNSFGSHL